MTNHDSHQNDLIPARMLNEFCYCPRLFHLEHVQREWRHNADTLGGRFVHRRADMPGGQVPDADETTDETRIHARSVPVGSQALGAVAVVDVLEGEDGKVVPVDYKRGRRPDIPEGAWEPERVQVCLQGLLLREQGYECDEGAVYFAESQSRVSVPLTDALIARTLQLIAEARTFAASDVAPPPLVDSPKCPRCSLVGICLPDETNLLRSEIAEGDVSEPSNDAVPRPEIRRLLPARDDRLPVYVRGHGLSVGLKGEVLEIRDKGKAIDEARLLDVSHVNLFGNVQLSAQALRELAGRDVPVLHSSYGGWLTAVTTPPPHKNIELRRRQFRTAETPDLCLEAAKRFVVGKIRNCRTLLRRNARDLPDEALGQLSALRRSAETADSLGSLLGFEGSAAREYFRYLPLMLKNEAVAAGFDFDGRNRRPPRDPVNALLSFAYAMLMKELLTACIGVGFDPYLGFYHQPLYGRPALALDLMEEFRPLVADSVVLQAINHEEVRPTDFIHRAGAVALTDAGRKRFIETFERRIDQLVTHPIFGYTISYRRVFEVQTRLLARWLGGEIPHYVPFVTR